MSFYSRELAYAKGVVAPHEIEERKSRAFTFSIPGRGSFYRYALTWTPGTLTLAGDLGEMNLTHYQALWDFQKGMQWAAGSGYDYLLGKSDKHQSFDREATFKTIVRMANERALDSLKGLRQDVQWWRDEKPQPSDYDLENEDSVEALWLDMARWWASKPKLKVETERSIYSSRYGKDIVPDGWEIWHAIAVECDGHAEDIFTGAARRALRDDLEHHLGDGGQEHAANICMRIGLDDYYGDTGWTQHDILQVQAIRTGAMKIIAHQWPYEWLER